MRNWMGQSSRLLHCDSVRLGASGNEASVVCGLPYWFLVGNIGADYIGITEGSYFFIPH